MTEKSMQGVASDLGGVPINGGEVWEGAMDTPESYVNFQVKNTGFCAFLRKAVLVYSQKPGPGVGVIDPCGRRCKMHVDEKLARGLTLPTWAPSSTRTLHRPRNNLLFRPCTLNRGR